MVSLPAVGKEAGALRQIACHHLANIQACCTTSSIYFFRHFFVVILLPLLFSQRLSDAIPAVGQWAFRLDDVQTETKAQGGSSTIFEAYRDFYTSPIVR